LLEADPVAFLQGSLVKDETGAGDEDAEIDQLIASRNEFKKLKNFAEADRLRNELLDKGIVLEDSAQGTTWRRA
jgi:cysteinyl-tRNA synthetase